METKSLKRNKVIIFTEGERLDLDQIYMLQGVMPIDSFIVDDQTEKVTIRYSFCITYRIDIL